MFLNSKPKYLIAGLGNPGSKYERTRHNAGFICADSLVNYYSASAVNVKANAQAFRSVQSDKEIYIIKPQTFMNLSGEAVRDVMKFFKIRIRPKGSDGGHNGIWDIIKNLNSEQFLRIKIGVGKKPNPEYDLKDWVLGKFSDEELKSVFDAAEKTGDICDLLMDGMLDKARNMYNG